MREAAISAGLVANAHAGDDNWRDRLRIITEPEAAAVHCAQLTDLHHLKASQNFMVCDAGGGTVDLAVYKVCKDNRKTKVERFSTDGQFTLYRLLDNWRTLKSRRCVLAREPTAVVCSSTCDSVN